MKFSPECGTSGEILFHGQGNRKLYLELKGIYSPEIFFDVLLGFDDFHIIRRDTGTPFSEQKKFLCRFYIDDDTFETILDEYEIYEI